MKMHYKEMYWFLQQTILQPFPTVFPSKVANLTGILAKLCVNKDTLVNSLKTDTNS